MIRSMNRGILKFQLISVISYESWWSNCRWCICILSGYWSYEWFMNLNLLSNFVKDNIGINGRKQSKKNYLHSPNEKVCVSNPNTWQWKIYWVQMGIFLKCNEINEIVRYKARLIAQGFSRELDWLW